MTRWTLGTIIAACMALLVGCGEPSPQPTPSPLDEPIGQATTGASTPTAAAQGTATASPTATPTRPATVTSTSQIAGEPDWSNVSRLELRVIGEINGYLRDDQGRMLGVDPEHPERGYRDDIPDAHLEPGHSDDTFVSPFQFLVPPTGVYDAALQTLEDGWVEIELITENATYEVNGKVTFPRLVLSKGAVVSLSFGPGIGFAGMRVTVDRDGDDDLTLAPLAWITGPSSDEYEEPDLDVSLEEQPSGRVRVTIEASDTGGSGVAGIYWWDFRHGFPDDETELLPYSEPLEIDSGAELVAAAIDRAGNWGGGDYIVVLPGTHDDLTGTLAIDGESVPFTIDRAGQNLRATFEGRAEQLLTLDLSGLTFAARVVVVDAEGVAIVEPEDLTGETGSVGVRLPADGTSTVFIRPEAGATGAVTLALSDTGEIDLEIVPDGPPQQVDITIPRQPARLTFNGEAGRRYVVAVTDVAIGRGFNGGARVSIVGPDGQQLTEPEGFGAGRERRTIEATLPSSGVWTILVEPNVEHTVSLTIQLFATEHPVDEIQVNGPPVTLVVPEPEDTASVTFAGRAGQFLELRIVDNRLGDDACCNAIVSVAPPPGVEWADQPGAFSIGEFVGTDDETIWMTLPADGVYTIVVDPEDDGSGSLTLALSEVREARATVSVGGPPVTITTAPGQEATMMFDANAGDDVIIVFTNVVFENVGYVRRMKVSLLGPDGMAIGDPKGEETFEMYGSEGKSHQFYFDLPVTGTYTILILAQDFPGSATIQVEPN